MPHLSTPPGETALFSRAQPLPELTGEMEFLSLLWELSHALEIASRKTARELGVTAQQRMLLRIVGRFPELTAGTLSRLLHVDPGTLSTALKRLEKRGLLERTRSKRDRRRVTIGLTEEGRAFDRPAKGTVESAVADLLRRTRASDLAAARRCVRALVQTLGNSSA